MGNIKLLDGGRIVKSEVVTADPVGNIIPTHSMSEKIERPFVLDAKVYKIKPGEHAYYITISDIVLNEGTKDEIKRPYEVFINTKDMSHFQWVAALSRMISAVMRKGGDLVFAIEELKASFDPAGGHWVDGTYVPSIVAHVGLVIERHLDSLGLLAPVPEIKEATHEVEIKKGGYCAKCQSFAVVQEEGCATCKNCGHSKCG